MRYIKIENNTCFLSLTKYERTILYSKKNISNFDLLSIFILQNLLENGQAELSNEFIIFDIDILYNVLSKNDLIGLDLPKNTSSILLISAYQSLKDANFEFRYSFLDCYPHGNKLDSCMLDGVMFIEDIPYILPFDIYKSILLIKEHSILNNGSKTLDTNLIYLAKIKKLLCDTKNVVFDSYLENEDVIIPDRIKLEINGSSENYILQPSVSKEIDKSFQKNFNIFPTVKNNYPSQEEGTSKRKRIILQDKQIDQLKEIKRINKVKENEELIRKISESPTTYFDTEIIDISDFYSERVIEIGLYKPKFSKFITPYKSEWLPGITIDFRNGGSDQIIINNDLELNLLTEKIKAADRNSDINLEYKEHHMPVFIAKELQKLAIRQLNAKTPIQEIDGEEIQQKKVLVIYENTDSLEYKTHENNLEEISPNIKVIKHRFYSVNNLKKDIKLKNHQEEGVAWLQNLYKENYEGCLLADDMGLGKTLQILYFIEWLGALKENGREHKPILIVAPISLMENWQLEYEKFFFNSSYSILPFYGSQPFEKKHSILI